MAKTRNKFMLSYKGLSLYQKQKREKTERGMFCISGGKERNKDLFLPLNHYPYNKV